MELTLGSHEEIALMVWNLKSKLAGGKVTVDPAVLARLQGQVAALNKALAVAEFDLKGRILAANDKFLAAFGYRLDEVEGQNHGMLVARADRDGDFQRQLWEKLGRAQSVSGQYTCVGKGGREVTLQATYSPVLDDNGKPFKVIGYATDITAQATAGGQGQGSWARTQDILRTAAAGDLTARVDTANVSGDHLKLAQNINLLLETVGETFANIQKVVTSATDGNLSARIDTRNRSGDLRKATEAVNHLLESVSEIVSNVKGAASEVLRGAEEISDGNMNLSQRTEQQSSSLEETASSMEEMTSTVKQNADNAGQASQLAMAARDQAEKGGSVVGKAVGAMTKINEASTKIAAIIGVIDDIAFQTNLLALNAAVEAARAGEQGRGFAVVATEVRILAGRSATAAKEIKELIQDSVQKVGDGSTLVTQSGQTLDQIVTSVKKVSDIVAEIAAASREQHSGIEQVNKAVMQMDEMTQQNAALVEQATAASRSMADQARQLSKLMERYDGGRSFVAAAPITPTRASEPVAAPERRSADRPWAGKSKPSARMAKQTEAAPPPRKAAAGGAGAKSGDADWLEF
jgi:methyl-accepting chemotaxis protein